MTAALLADSTHPWPLAQQGSDGNLAVTLENHINVNRSSLRSLRLKIWTFSTPTLLHHSRTHITLSTTRRDFEGLDTLRGFVPWIWRMSGPLGSKARKLNKKLSGLPPNPSFLDGNFREGVHVYQFKS